MNPSQNLTGSDTLLQKIQPSHVHKNPIALLGKPTAGSFSGLEDLLPNPLPFPVPTRQPSQDQKTKRSSPPPGWHARLEHLGVHVLLLPVRRRANGVQSRAQLRLALRLLARRLLRRRLLLGCVGAPRPPGGFLLRLLVLSGSLQGPRKRQQHQRNTEPTGERNATLDFSRYPSEFETRQGEGPCHSTCKTDRGTTADCVIVRCIRLERIAKKELLGDYSVRLVHMP